MDVDLAVPEGEPSRNKTGEEWWVASEMRADSAAPTLAGLVVYRASSDDGSGEDKAEVEEEVKQKRKSSADRKKEEKDRDTNNEREEEEEVDELDSGGVSDAVPTLKTKGNIFESLLKFILTSSHMGRLHMHWLAVDLNQCLRQSKIQPAVHTYMVGNGGGSP